MATETYIPRTTIEQQSTSPEDEDDKESGFKIAKRLLGKAAVGVMIGNAIVFGAKESGVNKIELSEDNITTYNQSLRTIINGEGYINGDLNAPVNLTVIDGESAQTYEVDDDPATTYSADQPAYVRALDFVDPLLLEATGQKDIQLTDLEEGVAGYVKNNDSDTIYLDKEYAESAAAESVAATIRHEAAHQVHFEAAPVRWHVSHPQFTNENPKDFHYLEETYPPNRAKYDMNAQGTRVSVSAYATTNNMEDFAEIASAMTAPPDVVNTIDTDIYYNKLKNGDELTIDKTAVVLETMNKVDPRLGNSVLDNIENHLDNKAG